MAFGRDLRRAVTDDASARFIGGTSARALVCRHVWNERGPICCVKRTGAQWYFSCGNDHVGRDKGLVTATVRELVARDRSLAPLATLNERHIAWRKWSDGPWLLMDEQPYWEERQSLYWWP